jgi:GNAT superfamily N-acetyltransferase
MSAPAAAPTIVEADLADPAHARDVSAMTAAYAEDAKGLGRALPAEVLARLVPALREHPTTVVLLAYVAGRAVGIATCFLGFSTFAARPLLNIHDLAVVPEHRGRGVARALLAAAEVAARRRGCVKLTLEVGEWNARARRVYEAAGFAQAHADQEIGGALFYTRSLG